MVKGSPEEEDSGGIDQPQEKSDSSPPPTDDDLMFGSRPKQVRGDYPVRKITWYQVNTSDIRSIGVAQAAATVFAALGTFALSSYLDLKKEMVLNEENTRAANFLDPVADLAFGAWLVFWGIAIVAFVWQVWELGRIKEESGNPSFLRSIIKGWLRRGTR